MTKEENANGAIDIYDSLDGRSSFAGGSGETAVEEDAGRGQTQDEVPAEIGMRVQEARRLRGFSVFDVYLRTNIPVDVLSQIEQGTILPPLGTVIKLAKAFDLKVGYFVSGEEGKDYTIVRREERKPTSRYDPEKERRHGYEYESLAPRKMDKHMEPFLVTLKPSETEEERSTHDGQEFIFVLQGSMEVRLGERVHVLESGDSIFYNAVVPHLVKCRGKEPTQILAVLYVGK